MDIKTIAIFHSPLTEKFGLPRQAGLAESLRGTSVLEAEFRSPEALRGLEGFDYLWVRRFTALVPTVVPFTSA